MSDVAELTGLRAVAILIVFASHVVPENLLPVPGGFGVTIFFFLSGYLITSLLRAEASQRGSISLKGFYVRRTLRILPPLYITMAFCALLWAVGISRLHVDLPSVLAQLFFVSNYDRLWGAHHGFSIPLWSLAVEEHFYLVFPLLFALVLRKYSGKTVAAAFFIACLVVLGLRAWQSWQFPQRIELNYYMTHTRIDSILWGSALAVWHNPILDKDAWKPSLPWFIGACGMIVVAALVQNPYWAEVPRYTLQGAGLFVVFSYVLHRQRLTSAILNHPFAQKIGLYSYTLYLIHQTARLAIEHWIDAGWVVVAVLSALLSYVYAWAMYRLVEERCAELRRSWHKDRAPAPMVDSPVPSVTP
ncbi:MAG: acyltransferase [Nitrobacter sp.]